jgi:hypothetical protein
VVFAVAAALFAALVALSLIFLLRRLSGALVQPLGGFGLITVALLSGLAAAGLRSTVLSTQYSVLTKLPLTQPLLLALIAAPGIASLVLLAALTLPGTRPLGIAIAWFLLIAGEAASWLALHRSRRRSGRRAAPVRPQPIAHPADETETPAGLVQQLTRVREGGRESLHAMVRAEIPAGDRLAVVHLAFCPPLQAPPELTAHAIDLENAEVRVTQAETFGVRLEVRLPRIVDGQTGVMVEVLGTARY